MKNIVATLIFTVSLSLAYCQDKPQLLEEPATWAFERFPLPPVFAPNIPFRGVEELRFAPGMFKKDSTDYFTYAFVAQLDSTISISQNGVRNYLLNYFTGLCRSTANDRKLGIDTSKITVYIEKKKGLPRSEIIYNALLNVFGVFADGAPVKLNMEVKVLRKPADRKTYVVFIASPLDKTHDVWEGLYKIQKHFRAPILRKG